MAGFGTAGSLVAGAAVLFVLASAVVAFRGWPQVGHASTPPAVVVARAPASGSSAGRRLKLVAAVQIRRLASARRPAAVTRAASPRVGTRVPAPRSVPAPGGGRGLVGATSVTRPSQPTGGGGGGAGGGGSGPVSAVGSTVQSVTGALHNVGSTVGSTVSGVVHGLGSTVAGTLSTATGSTGSTGSGVGGVVSGVGNALGGLTGR